MKSISRKWIAMFTLIFSVLFVMMVSKPAYAIGVKASLPMNGQWVSGSLSAEDEIQYYKIELPTYGKLTVDVSNSMNGGQFFLMNEDLSITYCKTDSAGGNWKWGASESNPKTWSDSRWYSPGTYYLKVITWWDGGSIGSFRLKATFIDGNCEESEPNNSSFQAMPLAQGRKVRAIITCDDVEDWYTFSLAKEADVNIRLEHFYGGICANLLDADMNVKQDIMAGRIWDGSETTPDIEDRMVTLPAGTYYIRCWHFDYQADSSRGLYTGVYNIKWDIKCEHVNKIVKNAVAAECTKDGYTGDSYCADCGELLSKGKPINALTHSYGKWTKKDADSHQRVCSRNSAHTESALHTWDVGVVTRAATSSLEGIKTYTCTVCAATKTEAIAKLPAPTVKVEKNRINKDAKAEEQRVLADKTEEAPKESVFYLLQLRYTKVTNTTVTLQWNKVPKAAKYVLFGVKCGAKYQKIGEFTKLTTVRRGLKKGNYYKFYLIAVNSSGKVIAGSKTVHVATKGGTVGNYKSVILKNVTKNALTLRRGKQFTIKASAVAESRQLIVKKHRGLAYESSNPKVATVSTRGVITAKTAGKTNIFVYSQSGTFAKIALTVK